MLSITAAGALRGCTVLAAAATCGLGIWMSLSLAVEHFPSRLPHEVQNPVLAVELVGNAREATVVLGAPASEERWRREREIRAHLRLDAWLIAAYTSYLVLLAIRLGARRTGVEPRAGRARGRPALAVAAMLLALGAGISDIVENQRIAELLEPLAPADLGPQPWALAKFVLFDSALLLTSLAFFIEPGAAGVQRWLRWLAGGFGVGGGLVGTFGAALARGWLIEAGVTLAAASIALGLIYFATQRWLRAGLLAALDRLATLPGFRRLASWPSEAEPDEEDDPGEPARP